MLHAEVPLIHWQLYNQKRTLIQGCYIIYVYLLEVPLIDNDNVMLEIVVNMLRSGGAIKYLRSRIASLGSQWPDYFCVRAWAKSNAQACTR